MPTLTDCNSATGFLGACLPPRYNHTGILNNGTLHVRSQQVHENKWCLFYSLHRNIGSCLVRSQTIGLPSSVLPALTNSNSPVFSSRTVSLPYLGMPEIKCGTVCIQSMCSPTEPQPFPNRKKQECTEQPM